MRQNRKPNQNSAARSNAAAVAATIENLGRRLEAETAKNRKLAEELKEAQSTIDYLRGMWRAEMETSRRMLEQLQANKYAEMDALIEKLHGATVEAYRQLSKCKQRNGEGDGEA